MEWCDEVFFATYSTTTDPKKVKNITSPERVMRTCEGPTHVAKNRLGMPYELPLEWAAYDYYARLAHTDPCSDSTSVKSPSSPETDTQPSQ